MDNVAALPDDAFDLFELRAIRTASTVSVSQAFGQHMSLTGAYMLRSVDVLDDDDAQNAFVNDYRTQVGTVGLQYSRPISRHAMFVLGYGVRGTDRAGSTGDPEILHNINGGVNYGRALSFSRRTSLSFTTGSAVAVIDRDDGTSNDRRTRAFLTGNAALTHELGRTWTATLSYTRALRTWDEFRQLYFTQAVNAQVGGLLSRRMSLTGGASWADSSLQNQGGGTHRGYSASVRTQYALSRFLALYAQYVYYHYRFSDVIVIDARIPRELDRQGVRVGLTTSIPLLR